MKVRLALVVLIFFSFAGCVSQTVRQDATSTPDAALQAYTQLGLQYLQAGDTNNAKQSLQRAIAINERYAPAHNAMGLVFQYERENKLAEEYFKRSTQLDPDNSMHRNNYGAFLFSQQRYPEACVELQKAADDPFYSARAQAFENVGRCYRMIGRLSHAEEAFKRALELNRSRPFAQVELADLLLDNGNLPEAMQWFDRFRQMVDNRSAQHSPRSLWVGVRIARAERNPSQAATYGLLLRNLYPDSEEYRLFRESVN